VVEELRREPLRIERRKMEIRAEAFRVVNAKTKPIEEPSFGVEDPTLDSDDEFLQQVEACVGRELTDEECKLVLDYRQRNKPVRACVAARWLLSISTTKITKDVEKTLGKALTLRDRQVAEYLNARGYTADDVVRWFTTWTLSPPLAPPPREKTETGAGP
jgi:hypothetical protein